MSQIRTTQHLQQTHTRRMHTSNLHPHVLLFCKHTFEEWVFYISVGGGWLNHAACSVEQIDRTIAIGDDEPFQTKALKQFCLRLRSRSCNVFYRIRADRVNNLTKL